MAFSKQKGNVGTYEARECEGTLEVTHSRTCHMSPIKTRSCEVPSSPWFPTGRPCSTFHVGKEGQRGVPEATHRLTLSGCGPVQGKEADAKEERMAWNWARCQRVCGGKHTPGLWWEARLQRKEGRTLTTSSLRSHTCAQALPLNKESLSYATCSPVFVTVHKPWQHTSKGLTLILSMFPPLCPLQHFLQIVSPEYGCW